MKIRNVSDTARQIPAAGQKADPGEVIDVPDDLGKSLVEQVDVWDSPAADKTPAKTPKQEGDK